MLVHEEYLHNFRFSYKHALNEILNNLLDLNKLNKLKTVYYKKLQKINYKRKKVYS